MRVIYDHTYEGITDAWDDAWQVSGRQLCKACGHENGEGRVRWRKVQHDRVAAWWFRGGLPGAVQPSGLKRNEALALIRKWGIKRRFPCFAPPGDGGTLIVFGHDVWMGTVHSTGYALAFFHVPQTKGIEVTNPSRPEGFPVKL